MTDTRVYRRVKALVYVGTHDGGAGVRLECGHLARAPTWEDAQEMRGQRVPCMECEVERAEREMAR